LDRAQRSLPLGFRDRLPGRIRRPEDLQVVGLGLGHRREREIAVVGGRGIGVDPPANPIVPPASASKCAVLDRISKA
jgi:hypothetical protein